MVSDSPKCERIKILHNNPKELLDKQHQVFIAMKDSIMQASKVTNRKEVDKPTSVGESQASKSLGTILETQFPKTVATNS